MIKLYPHQLKTPWGFCTDGEKFLPSSLFPWGKSVFAIPSYDNLSHVYNR